MGTRLHGRIEKPRGLVQRERRLTSRWSGRLRATRSGAAQLSVNDYVY
jgi:hypothetical protein